MSNILGSMFGLISWDRTLNLSERFVGHELFLSLWQTTGTAGWILLIVFVQLLFIQLVLVGKVMENCRYYLLFLFLMGSLLLPTLPGALRGTRDENSSKTAKKTEEVELDQSTSKQQFDKAVSYSTSHRQAEKTTIPSKRDPAQTRPELTFIEPLENQLDSGDLHGLARKDATRNQSVAKDARSGIFHELDGSKSRANWKNVSQPREGSDNRKQPPTPVMIRGNLPNYPANSGTIANTRTAPQTGTYYESPQPIATTANPATGTGIVQQDVIPRGNGQISPASFDIQQPKLPNIGPLGTTMEIDSRGTQTILDQVATLLHQGVTRAMAAVVHIEARVTKESNTGRKREVDETGCGVLAYLQQKYYVITNGHVAGRAVSQDQVNITLADKRVIHPVRILTCDEIDIALLELSPNDLYGNMFDWNAEVHCAQFANSDTVRIPDDVFTIGSPFGLSGSVSRGVVSGRERRKIPLGNRQDQIQDFIQTDAAINPGNSGGPLLNTSGHVVGIVTAIASNTGGSEGVAFALPINNVLQIANQLAVTGTYQRPYMGVELDPQFDAQARSLYGLNRSIGTRVIEVKPRSPAESVGLKKGDIILFYNGIPVQDDQHLVQLIGLSQLGQQPQISILRNNTQMTLTPLLSTASNTAYEQ